MAPTPRSATVRPPYLAPSPLSEPTQYGYRSTWSPSGVSITISRTATPPLYYPEMTFSNPTLHSHSDLHLHLRKPSQPFVANRCGAQRGGAPAGLPSQRGLKVTVRLGFGLGVRAQIGGRGRIGDMVKVRSKVRVRGRVWRVEVAFGSVLGLNLGQDPGLGLGSGLGQGQM